RKLVPVDWPAATQSRAWYALAARAQTALSERGSRSRPQRWAQAKQSRHRPVGKNRGIRRLRHRLVADGSRKGTGRFRGKSVDVGAPRLHQQHAWAKPRPVVGFQHLEIEALGIH